MERRLDYDVTKNGHGVAPMPAVGAELPAGVTYEQALAMIEQERNTRAQACLAEVNAVLEKYNCTLVLQSIVQAR